MATIDEVAEVIGTDVIRQIAYEMAGQELYVSKKRHCFEKIARLAGLNAAFLITAHFEGDTIKFSKKMIRKEREAEIMRLYDSYHSVSQIQQRTGVSHQTVYNVISKNRGKKQRENEI